MIRLALALLALSATAAAAAPPPSVTVTGRAVSGVEGSELNTTVESFPSNMVAGAFGLGKRDFFQAGEADRVVPSVSTTP